MRPVLCALACLLFASRAQAEPTLTDDWPRLRDRLRGEGVSPAFSYTSETATNVTGGERRRATEAGQLAAGATFDLERLVSVHGGKVQATITYRSGDDLGKDAGLGVLQQAQEIYGRGQTLRLTQLWYEEAFPHVQIKAGRVTVGEDIGTFSCLFMNLSFCGAPPGAIISNYWFNWPVSQWGGRVRVKNDQFYATVGTYEVNPRNLDKPFALGYFHGARGLLLPAEVGFTPRVGKAGLPGTYKYGVWFDTSQDRFGFFGELQQQLTPQLVAFTNFTQASRVQGRIDNQIATGIFYRDLGVGAARTHLNARNPGMAEHAIEVFYSLHPFPWWILRPNAQLIHDPGGVETARPVVVLGLKALVTL